MHTKKNRGRIKTRPFGSLLLLFSAAAVVFTGGCSGDGKEQEQPVPVEIVAVEKQAIEQTVTADAVLFPINQAALVPKISAPVKKFYVNRASHVRQGQLLAVLENRDLAAATADSRGAYEQAQANYATAMAADIPQLIQKAQLDEQAAKKQLDAQQRIYDSRKELFEQGALPRKDLDQAGVDLTNARNQYEIARKKLDALIVAGPLHSRPCFCRRRYIALRLKPRAFAAWLTFPSWRASVR